MRTKTFAAAGVAAVLTLGAVAWAWEHGSGGRGVANPRDAAQVALGKQVYQAQCASCHGGKLEGQPDWRTRKPSGALPAPPHGVDGHTWHHPDQQLFAITKHGVAAFAPPGYVTDMPAFDDVLTDDEIWAVLAFIKSRWPAEVRAEQAKRTAAAERS